MAMSCTACATPATAQCTACNSALCAAHVQAGQPFISARQLVTTTASTAVRAPAMLGDLLFKELVQVPYCESCRVELATKRTGEQLKFLVLMLLVLAVVVGLPAYLLLIA